MRPIGLSLKNITHRVFRRFGFANGDLLTHWRDIVGVELAAVTKPQRIVVQRAHADNAPVRTLLISVAPEHLLDVQHQTPQILQQLNSWFGYDSIARIKIRPTSPKKMFLSLCVPLCLFFWGCESSVPRDTVVNPDSKNAYLVSGKAWLDRSAYKKALLDLTQAIQKNPLNAEAYYLRGHAWDGQRQLNKALGDYSRAIALDPEHAYAYLYRSFVWRAKGEEQKADQDEQKAAALGLIWGGPQGYIDINNPVDGF